MLLIQILIYSKLRPSLASEIIMTVIATLTTVFYGRFVILFSVFETQAYAAEMCIVVYGNSVRLIPAWFEACIHIST